MTDYAGYILTHGLVIDAIGDTPEQAIKEYVTAVCPSDEDGEPLGVEDFDAAELLRADNATTGTLYMRPATSALLALVRDRGGDIAWGDGDTRHDPSDIISR